MRYLTLAFFIGGFAARLSAGAIFINNPSFEADVLGCSPSTTCSTFDTVSNWTGGTADPNGFTGPESVSGTFGVYKPSTTSYPTGIPDGVNVAYLFTGSYSDSISQTLAADLLANDTYTLTALVGAPAGGPGCSGFNVSLLAGGNVLNSITGEGEFTCVQETVGTFTEFTVTYTSPANPVGLGDPLQIVLEANGSGSSIEQAEIDFDKIALSDTLTNSSPTVPEPATLGMVCTALLGLGWWARKRA
jgi:hypothetical protein